MEYLEAIQFVRKALQNRELAILYGTGLSYNSGVFTSKDFYVNILRELSDDNGTPLCGEEVKEMTYDRISQFEDFLMRIYDDFDYEHKDRVFNHLLKIFDVGEPNTNHRFLAYLMNNNFVNNIFTTNFDALFEKALLDEIKSKSTYRFPNIQYNSSGSIKKCCKPEYKEFEKNLDSKRNYIKLHGCVTELSEISTLITRVASKLNKNIINIWIEKLLVHSDIRYILVMGYSFSDAYDIQEALKKVVNENTNAAEFIIVDHSEHAQDCYSIRDYILEKKRRGETTKIPDYLQGMVIECDTDKFVEEVWNRLGGYKPCKHSNAHCDSEKCVKTYIQELRQINKGYYIYLHAWRFHYEVGQNLLFAKRKPFDANRIKAMEEALKKSIKYAEKTLDIIAALKEKNDLRYKYIDEILAQKHKLLSQIALSDKVNINDNLLKLKKLAKNVVSSAKRPVNMWLKSELLYFYLMWTYDCLTYGLIDSGKRQLNVLFNETNKLINELDNYKSISYIKLVYYRLLILKARVHYDIDPDDINMQIKTKKEYDEAEDVLNENGRVEYLPFLYHGYARLLGNIYSRNKDQGFDALQMYEKAIYLYRNLGDQDRKIECIEDLKQFISKIESGSHLKDYCNQIDLS